MWPTLEYLLYSKYFWITTIFSGIYIYLKFYVYAYWKNQGISHESPVIFFGNVLPAVTGKIYLGNLFRENYEKFRNYRFHGIYVFNQAALMINDPKLIHQVLIKQFDKFNGRGIYSNEKIDPLTANLFVASGEKWMKLRFKLTPVFTPNKLKEMFSLIKNVGDEMIEICDKTLVENDVVEIKDLMSRYTTDIIASIAYGFNCQSLKDPENDFKRYGVMAFDVSPLKNIIVAHAPIIFEILRIPYWRKDITYFFTKMFRDVVEYRKQNQVVRKDLVTLLMQLMDKGALDNEKSDNVNDKLTMLEAQAQAFVFFLGGYETSSSTMTYLLYELAMNHEIQEKTFEEIREFVNKGEINYKRIKDELPYLQMVLSETMRKYPALPILQRQCNKDWKIPDSDFTIKKETSIFIPVMGLHYNPEMYPDPEKFDPDRFLNEHDSTESSRVYLPFGAGPRHCIGSIFAKFQMKLGLVALLGNYKFSICERTVVPIQHSKRSFTKQPEGGVYLRMEKRMEDH